MTRRSRLPKGWDEKRIQKVLTHYESQTDEEAVAEDESAHEDGSIAYIAVPRGLVNEVQELIRKRTGTSG